MSTNQFGASTFGSVDINNPLSKLSQGIKDSVTGLAQQTINPLKAVFESANSGVALVSENDTMLNQALTTFKSINIEKITQGVTDLVGGILNNPDLGSILTYEDGFKVDTSQLMRIASQGLGFNVGGIADIKQQLGDSFLQELNEMTGGLTNGLYFEDGKKLVMGDGWQMGMGESLIGFIGRQDADWARVFNVAGVNSILNVMIRQAAENSMYQSYESFSDQYLFQSDYHNAIINSMEYCIARGDILSINKMLEIIGTDGLNKVKALYPDLIERTLVSFYFTENTTEEDYPELGRLLNQLLVTVGGADWYITNTSFGPASNLAVVSGISDAAKLLLSDFDQYVALLCTASVFTDESALDAFQRDFPKSVRFEN